MKKIFLLLTFVLLSIAGFSQGFKTGGIFLRVTDSATYVNSAYVTAAHADNYAEIFYSVSSGLFWKWNGSTYEQLGSGSGGGSLNTLTPNIQTGATYTVAATDTAKIIYMRHASTPQTATIPSGLKVGSTFVIVQDSTAVTTIICTGCDLIGTATLTAKEVSVWHHRETGKYVRLGSSSSSGHVIEEEGTPLTQRANMNFTGAGVAVTDAGGKTVVTIAGGGAGDVTSTSYAFAALTDAATVSWSVTSTEMMSNRTLSIGANRTFGAPSGMSSGAMGTVLTTASGADRTINIPAGANHKLMGVGDQTAKVISIPSGATFMISWKYDGTNWWWWYVD